ncbi:MAG TPA: hypothetical protein VGI39_13115 [Polyangiaceae bacterium]
MLLLGSLLAAANARAQGPGPTAAAPGRPNAEAVANPGKDAAAYCRWVKAIAASNSDVLMAPSVYATAGYVSGADSSTQSSAVPPTGRLIAAGLYSFGGLNRGLALRAQADAECKRYAAESELRAFIERNRDAQSVEALKAKAKVLDEALPRATEILSAQKAQLAQARLTVDEVDGTQLRTDALRALAAQVHQDLTAMATAPPPPARSVRETLAQRDAAEEEAERRDGRVRASYGWDLTLRGGYDQIFGVRDYTPVFGLATLTLDLGWFLQGASNDEARVARKEWVRAQVEGVDDRVEQVVQRLHGARDAEAARLRENTVLLADLEERFKSVGSLGGEKARAYADYVWFDLTRVRADHAYYTEHVRELDALLGDAGSAGMPTGGRSQ